MKSRKLMIRILATMALLWFSGVICSTSAHGQATYKVVWALQKHSAECFKANTFFVQRTSDFGGYKVSAGCAPYVYKYELGYGYGCCKSLPIPKGFVRGRGVGTHTHNKVDFEYDVGDPALKEILAFEVYPGERTTIRLWYDCNFFSRCSVDVGTAVTTKIK